MMPKERMPYLFLLTILTTWVFQKWIDVILMKEVATENRALVIMTRLGLLGLLAFLALMVWIVWKRRMTRTTTTASGSAASCSRR